MQAACPALGARPGRSPAIASLVAPLAARWRRVRLPAPLVRLLCALAVFAVPATANPAQAYPELFGTKELHSQNLKLFPKWRGVVERFRNEKKACPIDQCNAKLWASLIDPLRAEDRMSQVADVNREMNARPYVEDIVNWGVPDYWATPFQFLRKDGDCEDYAIAKFMALRALGVPNDAMRVVVLQDMNLNLAHAILVVYVDGQAMVLDNQIKTVVPATSIHHYRPVYSINEDGWWLHRQ